MAPVAPPRVWHSPGPSLQRVRFLLSGSQHPGEGQISEDSGRGKTGAGKAGPENRFPRAGATASERKGAAGVRASDSSGTGHAASRPPFPLPGRLPPTSTARAPAPLTPARHLVAASRLAWPSPRPAQPATGDGGQRGAGTGNPAASGAPWCWRGWARAVGDNWTRARVAAATGRAAPGVPPTAGASDHPQRPVGQAGWFPLACPRDSQGRPERAPRTVDSEGSLLAPPRWCCVKGLCRCMVF